MNQHLNSFSQSQHNVNNKAVLNNTALSLDTIQLLDDNKTQIGSLKYTTIGVNEKGFVFYLGNIPLKENDFISNIRMESQITLEFVRQLIMSLTNNHNSNATYPVSIIPANCNIGLSHIGSLQIKDYKTITVYVEKNWTLVKVANITMNIIDYDSHESLLFSIEENLLDSTTHNHY